ncbi:hypothetical protein [Acidithrix ferrooxidans]|uniref:Uncharacterized protein n=1 Tax=Acidithrix ferrooxidans TaxID=1280514 RepID=A0A0D8HIR0_9ACTN|nr:hypothetical protein [Acidithrix ferrooxidans]KJF16956.1 hypothetical protein AXFE_21580 [Acidithrix ferrooxidans]
MKQSEIIKLQTYLRNWYSTHSYGWHLRGAQEIAKELLQDTAFTDIKLASWLESPEGSTIAQVVESVIPFPGNIEITVMTDAVMIAAKNETSGQVVGVLAIGIVAVLILWGLSGDSSGTLEANWHPYALFESKDR